MILIDIPHSKFQRTWVSHEMLAGAAWEKVNDSQISETSYNIYSLDNHKN